MTDTNSTQPLPLFARRLPLLQHLQSQDQMVLDYVTDSFFPGLAHYHQMMTLAAGVAGVVVPVLHSQPTMINQWFLRRAAICMGVTIAIGVLIVFVSRWVHVALMHGFSRRLALREMLLGETPDDEVEVARALQKATDDTAPRLKKFRQVLPWGVVGDLLFYGSFLRGVAYLIEGFVLP